MILPSLHGALALALVLVGTLPSPDLARMEPVVRRQLEQEGAALKKAVDSPAADSAALAAAYGRCGAVYAAYDLAAAAVACFENAAAHAPADPRWPYYLGFLAQKRSDLDAARSFFERVLALRPGDPPALRRLGEVELAAGGVDAARARFAALLAGDPAYAAAAHYGLGRLELLRGDAAGAREAVAHFEAVLARQPQASLVDYQLGMAYKKLGQTEQARAHLAAFGDAPVAAPDPLIDLLAGLNTSTRRHADAGAQALQEGRLAAAVQELRQALAADPHDAKVWSNLGVAQQRLRDPAAAEESFRKAVESDPGAARAHYNLGSLLAQRGLREAGIEHLETAVRLDPDLMDARFNLATALLESGETARALAQYDAILARSPGDMAARYNRGTTLLRLGRAGEAEEELGRVAAAAPEAVEPAVGHASALAALRRFGAAAGEQRRAVELAARAERQDLQALRSCLQLYEQGRVCPDS